MPLSPTRHRRALAMGVVCASLLGLSGCSSEPADPKDDREICQNFLDVSARWVTSVTSGEDAQGADSALTDALTLGEERSQSADLKGAFRSLGETIRTGIPNDVLRVLASTMQTCVATGATLPPQLTVPPESIFPTSSPMPPLVVPSGLPGLTP